MVSRMILDAAFSSGAAAAGLEAKIQYLTTEREQERVSGQQWLEGVSVDRAVLCVYTYM